MTMTEMKIKSLDVAVIIMAAGFSSRMEGRKKEFLPLPNNQGTVLSSAATAFLQTIPIKYLLVTVPSFVDENIILQTKEALFSSAQVKKLLDNSVKYDEKIELVFVPGGKTRQESVLFALEKIASLGSVDMVLIHDGARPFVSKEIVKAVFEKVKNCGAACCGVSPVDTQKEVDSQGNITKHLQRSSMVAVQTPQGFLFQPLLEAHRKAAIQNIQCTDDTEIWSKFCDTSVQVVKGSPENIKITFPGDLIKMNQTQLGIKIGLGYDLHRLVEDRPLMLGGVKIPSPKGETGHSDGDVLCHAITDSLLGAAGLGDIGEMFPPSDEKWKDADSKDLLKQAWKRVKKEGWGLINLDCVIKLEKPKILPFRKEIISTLATVLEVDTEKIFLKAKTGEGQDSVGNGESVEAWATCLLTK